MRVQSLLRTVRPAVTIAGLFVLIGGVNVGTAAAQRGKPVPKPVPKIAAPLPLSVARTGTVFVQVGTLQPSNTIERSIPFNPRPTTGVMNVSGTWSRSLFDTEQGSVDITLEVTVKSPSGAIVVKGCGFSSDSTRPLKTQLHANGLAKETTVSIEAAPQWTVSVKVCGPVPLTEITNVRIRIDY